MKIIKKKLAAFAAICLFIILTILSAQQTQASEVLFPTPCDNLRVGLRSNSELVATDDGYMRVYYDGKKNICIEYYDHDFQILRKQSLDMELDIWGGFFAGSDAYYIVEGQNNEAENDSAEVIRVLKYDKNWNKQGVANIPGNPSMFGGQVRYPFDYGCVEMEEYDGMLYIVTGHEGYVDPQYGQGHQGFLIIEIQESSMRGAVVGADLWHSFAQYIVGKDSDLYILEQSEGDRRTQLVKVDARSLHGVKMSVLPYGGSSDSAWALPCYASVDGLAVSSDSILGLGTSIDQSQYDSYSKDMPYNIYLTVTPVSDFSVPSTKVKWLTDYSNNGKRFLGTKITKVNDSRFMVSWQEANEHQNADGHDSLSSNVLHYVFLDGKGDKVSEEFTAAAPISDCQPIIKDSKIVYYASDEDMVNFYSIDAQTGKFSKKVYSMAENQGTENEPNDENEPNVENKKIHISKARIGGIKKSYVYKGRSIKPKVTVKFEGKTLKKGKDYTVSYINNKAPGTAAIKIKGKNGYYGTVNKEFVIKRR